MSSLPISEKSVTLLNLKVTLTDEGATTDLHIKPNW